MDAVAAKPILEAALTLGVCFSLLILIVYVVGKGVTSALNLAGALRGHWFAASLSVGITLFFYPQGVYALYTIIWIAQHIVFFSIPSALAANAFTIVSYLSGDSDFIPPPPPPITGDLQGNFLIDALRSFAYSVPDFNAEDFVKVLYFLVICVILGLCLVRASSLFSTSQEGGGRGELPERTRTILNGFAFAIILLGAGYLSITSIIAIPALKEDENEISDEVSGEKLREKLKLIAHSMDQFSKIFPETLGVKDFNELTNRKVNALKEQFVGQKEQASVSNVEALVFRGSTDLIGFEHSWGNLRSFYLDQQTTLLERAVAIYELANLNRKGARERTQHFLDIFAWFGSVQTAAHQHLRDCRGAIERHRSELDRLLTEPRLASRPPQGQLAQMPVQQHDSYSFAVFNVASTINEARELAFRNCGPGDIEPLVPVRGDLGASLGFFGQIGNWLLETESLALALIIGLVGFGLFGAACSTFIRSGDPVAVLRLGSMASVIVRGISAAILVFLATYGGLAVIGSGEANPNPYVVLFFCLLAAVFSEDAWAWGADRFRGQFDRKRGAPNDAAPAPQQGG